MTLTATTKVGEELSTSISVFVLKPLPTLAIPVSDENPIFWMSGITAALTEWVGVVGNKAIDRCIIDGASTIAVSVLQLQLGLLLRLQLVLNRAGARAVLQSQLRLLLRLQLLLHRTGATAILLLQLGLRLHGLRHRSGASAVLLLRLGLRLQLLLNGAGAFRDTRLDLHTRLRLDGLANRAAP